MAESVTLFAWMDLETNGRLLQGDGRYIGTPFEIAMVITDDKFNVLTEYTSFVYDKNRIGGSYTIPDVVYKMHLDSGLLQEMDDQLSVGTLPDIRDIDFAIANILLDTKNKLTLRGNWNSVEIKLAGSGVSHFDSRWIKFYFPNTWNELAGFDVETKPTIDIGVVRRFLQHFTNLNIPHNALPVGNHRALNDIYAHIAEAEWIATHINRVEEYIQEHVNNSTDWLWLQQVKELEEYKDNQ